MRTLDDILHGYSLDELGAMVDYLDAPVDLSSPKRDVISLLSGYLSNSPDVWLSRLPENDLRLLGKLEKAGPGQKILIIRPDYPPVVEALKIVKCDQYADFDMVEVSMSETIYQIIAPHIHSVIAAKEINGAFRLEQTIMGYLNIYGVLPLKTFVSLFFDDVSGDEKDLARIAREVAECPIFKLYQERVKRDVYLVSPFVCEAREILDARREHFRDIRRYAANPSRTELITAGQSAPFCAYGLHTPEGEALLTMLRDVLDFSGEELQEAIHNVWMCSQFAMDDESTEHLFEIVTDRQDELGSFELFKHCIDVLVDYSNSVPKWLLKGHSAKEVNSMLITVRVDELVKEYNYEEPGLNLYRMGLAVKPVAPDALCPCGSGLSYRNCHGKVLN